VAGEISEALLTLSDARSRRLKARERRCSSLVGWPVYPRWTRTVRATQSGAWSGIQPSPIFAPSNGARSCARGWRGKAVYWPLRAGRSRTVAFRWAAVSSLAAGNSGGAAAARRIQAPSGLAQSPQIGRGLPFTIVRNGLCAAFFVRRLGAYDRSSEQYHRREFG
jgi:hypothetical protein